MDILQGLCQTERFVKIDSYTECVAAVFAAFNSDHLGSCVWSLAQGSINFRIGIVNYFGIALKRSITER